MRLFLAAYYLSVSAAQIMLPPTSLAVQPELQVARGLLAAGSGLLLLWLGIWRTTPDRYLAGHLGLMGVQLVLALERAAAGAPNAAIMLLVFGVGVGLLGLAPRLAVPGRWSSSRADWLTAMVGLTVAIYGLAIVTGADPSGTVIQQAGLSAGVYGSVMLVTGAAATILALREPASLGWAAIPGLIAGTLVIAIPILAAIELVEPLFLFVSISAYLRASVLIAPWAWRRLAELVDWASLGTRFGIVCITASTVPLLVVGGILAHNPPVDGAGLDLGLTAAALATLALALSVAGGVLAGQAQARSTRRLAASLQGVPAGADAPALDEGTTELLVLSRAIRAMTNEIQRQRADSDRRATLAVDVEQALTRTVDPTTMLSALVEALVSSFCDAAAIYRPVGAEIERIHQAGPDAPLRVVRRPLREGAGLASVLTRGEPWVIVGPDAGREARDRSDDGASPPFGALRAMGIHSLVVVPIVAADGSVLAAIAAATFGGERRLTQRDAATLAEFAGRAGLSLENARLIAALQTSNRELQTANAIQDEFLGLVSHEIKTPITIILGNIALLERDPLWVDREDAIRDILQETRRLSGMVDNLLGLARLGSVDEMSATEPVLIERIARLVVDDIRRQIAPRQIDLACDPGLIVEATADQVDMVLRNLLTNAAKYSDPGTPIEVTARRAEDRVVVAVADRGKGVRGTDSSRLFDAFYRGEAPNPRVPGLGIGLSVCKRIVDSLGGQVWGQPRPDGGSIFAFWLPLTWSDEDGPPRPPGALDIDGLDGLLRLSGIDADAMALI